jgi:hypothetical protein
VLFRGCLSALQLAEEAIGPFADGLSGLVVQSGQGVHDVTQMLLLPSDLHVVGVGFAIMVAVDLLDSVQRLRREGGLYPLGQLFFPARLVVPDRFVIVSQQDRHL